MARRISSDDRKALLADVREEIGRSKEDVGESIEKAMRAMPVMDSQQAETRRQFRFTEPGATAGG